MKSLGGSDVFNSCGVASTDFVFLNVLGGFNVLWWVGGGDILDDNLVGQIQFLSGK